MSPPPCGKLASVQILSDSLQRAQLIKQVSIVHVQTQTG